MSEAQDDRERVLAWLQRREEIRSETQRLTAQREQRRQSAPGAPPEVDPVVFAQVEEEFYAAQGKVRYVAHNGQVRWLTPQEVEQRKSERKRKPDAGRFYGPAVRANQRRTTTWLFNAAVVFAGVVIVWVILR